LVVRVEPQTPLASLIMSPQRNVFVHAVKWLNRHCGLCRRLLAQFSGNNTTSNFASYINRMQILIVARISIRHEERGFYFGVSHFTLSDQFPVLTKGTLLTASFVSTESCGVLISHGENLVFISWRGWGPDIMSIPLYFRLKLNSDYDTRCPLHTQILPI